MKKRIFGILSILVTSCAVILAACGDDSGNSSSQEDVISQDGVNTDNPNVLTCDAENNGEVVNTADEGYRKCEDGLWVSISSSSETVSSSSEASSSSSVTPDTDRGSSSSEISSSSESESSSSEESSSSSSNTETSVLYKCDDGSKVVDASKCTPPSQSTSSEAVSSSGAEQSSSSEAISTSSSESVSSSSEEQSSNSVVSSSSKELSEACKALRSTQSDFVPLEDVFECILPNEKVVFLIRHAERDKDDKTNDLNDNGRNQSIYLGQKLESLNLEDFYYMSTKVYRTKTTAILISRGKGETFLDSLNIADNGTSQHYKLSDDFTESWFKKDKSIDNCDGIKSWARFTKMAYDKTACPDAFYDVDDKVAEIVNKHFIYKDIENITIVATHDSFLAPFLISVTDRKIGLEAHEYVTFDEYGNQNNWNQNVFKHWPNYLAGAAIIINEKDGRTFVPVRGLKTGYLGYHCPNNEDEDGLYTCNKWEKNTK